MDRRALLRLAGYQVAHPQRRQRLGTRTRQAPLHPRPAAQRHQRQRPDGGHCERFAKVKI